jgi:hypothetical protein
MTRDTAASLSGSSAPLRVPVIRSDIELRPDTSRVVVRPFLPDEKVLPGGGLLDRILGMPEDDVASTLAVAYAQFEGRQLDLP